MVLGPGHIVCAQAGGELGSALASGGERHSTAHVFGQPWSSWLTVSGGVATDFEDARDLQLTFGYTTFLAHDIELSGELGLWAFDQPGDNALGASLSAVFRWHFVHEGDLSLFVDAGIGVLGATDLVPDEATAFGLLPRFGVGLTHRIGADGSRIIAGARWHHISNARIHGETDNPSRDGLMLYAGLVLPLRGF